MKRTIQQLVTPDAVSDGAGVRLKRIIASRALNYLDPFLLLDHFGSDNPDDYIAGFPMHPHRGIETVTYMLSGEVHHKDSMGHSGSIGPGDIQWMTAGSGIMHEEMPQLRGGHLSGFQLWVNLPAKVKMSRPRYQEYSASQVPEVKRADGASVKVVAGEFDGHRGPVTNIAANPTYLDVSLPANVKFTHPIPQGHSCFAYVFHGDGNFGDSIQAPRLVVFSDGDSVEVQSGSSGVRFLLVSGKPLGEPIARYGPFVMNTKEEIQQAIADLQNGTFVKS